MKLSPLPHRAALAYKDPMNARKTRRRVIVGPSVDLPFGEIIRQAVEAQGLTQREFAERLGVRQPRVAEIFRQSSMTEALLDRCVAALGLELEVKVVEP